MLLSVQLNVISVLFFQSFFAERFFSLFKTGKDCDANSISMRDLCQGLELLTNGSQIEKLQFLFNVYDIDGKLFFDRCTLDSY